jgi:branched-chain amino acid transport system permease protein
LLGGRIISDDRPGHPLLSVLLGVLLLALAVTPFIFPGTRSLAVAERICIFIVLAASYDILLGYTGIVSFAHTMFFAFGAYGIAIPLSRGWVGWDAILVGTLATMLVSGAVSAGIAMLTLRVRRLFFSMITLAAASFVQLLATELRSITGGEDGLTFELPRILSPAFRLTHHPVLGVGLNGRIITYYMILSISLALFLFMLRIVNAPFGRVLQAIRENEFRAEALGYRTVIYRTWASILSAIIAALAGVLMALMLRYNGPDTTLSFSIMIDVLLMVVIGGMGTLYGPALGAAVVVLAEFYLQPALGTVNQALLAFPVLPFFFDPSRWLLWLGCLFIAIVYFFPSGVVGTLRRRGSRQ